MSFRILTDLDSIMDTRQGVLSDMLSKHNEKFDNVYGQHYFTRILDKFDREPFGITSETYRRAYTERGIPAFVKARPSRLMKHLFKVVIDAEALIGKPIKVDTLEITVLTHPYDIPDDVLSDIKVLLEGNLGYLCKVNFVKRDPGKVTAQFVSQFTHVFLYHLLGEQYLEFTNTFDKAPSPDTKLFIPAVFLKEPDEKGITPTAQIQRNSLLWSVFWTVIPLSLSFWDAISLEEVARLEQTLKS